MKIFKRFCFLITLIVLCLHISYAQNKTPAYMLSSIDGNTNTIYITRTQALLKQLSTRYIISEIEVSDKIVVLCHKILRDEYGINQKMQYSLERST